MEKTFPSSLIGCLIIFVSSCICDDDVCDRRPLGIKTDALRPDNQFVLEIEDIKDNKYTPGWKYNVNLRSRDETSSFIAFTISIKEDTIPNKNNIRKPIHLSPGRLEAPRDSTTAKASPVCNNTIIQSDVTAKTKVQVLWTAPGKGNKCVSIFAVVAMDTSVWYSYDGPLSMRVCEDPRKSDDVPPVEVDGNCQTCEDVRYKLTFEGLWSYNTHPTLFPTTKELARFSDVVGASHSPDTSVFKFATEATIGIKMLAEQGNTTQFEIEIQEQLPKLVRTVIKATSPKQTDMSTTTSFRASPEHHRLSIAAGILPSPDWFLGVSNLELCKDQSSWYESIRLNLYPIDAGTDKGTDFESSNEEQSPPQPISLLAGIGKEQRPPNKPFARLLLNRVRTYTTPECMTEIPVTENQGEENGSEEETEPSYNYDDRNVQVTRRPTYVTQRTTTSEEPPVIDPASSDACPMTNWEDWQPCEGMCVNGSLTGLQTRIRYYIVDGVVINKYMEHGTPVSQYCLDHFSDMEYRVCEDTCNENAGEEEEENDNAEASRRSWLGYWGRK